MPGIDIGEILWPDAVWTGGKKSPKKAGEEAGIEAARIAWDNPEHKAKVLNDRSDPVVEKEVKKAIGGRDPNKKRGVIERFGDAANQAALHNPMGLEFPFRLGLKARGLTDAQIARIEMRYFDFMKKIDEKDPVMQGSAQERFVKVLTELAGGVVGGMDPTYALSPGKSVIQRIASQSAINAGQDMAAQSIEKKRGVREKIDPTSVAINAVAGAVFQGGSELARLKKKVNDVIVNDLEGGGTLENPKVSPKGAMGPQQVMPETARKPGFGIRPWDGKSQKDLARVGREYSAAMTDKYDGDVAKVLAAYNGGPGRTDKAIAIAVRRGEDDWLKYMPKETRDYVAKGLKKVGNDAGLRPMSPDTLAKVMKDPEAGVRRTDDIDEPVIEDREEVELLTSRDEPVLDNGAANRNDKPNWDMNDPLDRLDRLWDEGKINDAEYERQRIKIERADLSQQELVDYDNIESAHLTPAERQEMDASAPNPPPRDNLAYEKHTPYVDEPNQAANDIDSWDAARNFVKNIFEDDSGSYRPGGYGSDGGDDLPPPPMDSKTEKLIYAIETVKPMRAEQQAMYRSEYNKRFNKAKVAAQIGSGKEGANAFLGSLKGEMPKVDYESFSHLFEPEEIDELFNMVLKNNYLDEKVKAKGITGLNKLLSDEYASLPNRSELQVLSRIFPKELIDAILGKRTWQEKLGNALTEALATPRALMATGDMSAPLRQGIFFVGRKEFYSSFRDMFKKFASENAFEKSQAEISARPNYRLMDENGLALTGTGKFVDEREEQFMSHFLQDTPVLKQTIGQVTKMSERAYVGFLNQLRADIFDDFVLKGRNLGIDFNADPRYLKDAAILINAGTGRGGMGKLAQATSTFSQAFFSPRLIASRLRLLNPFTYLPDMYGLNKYALHPVVRKEAWKSLASFAGLATTVMTLASLGGLAVMLDPRSSDFGKIRHGDTRIDVLGGFGQYMTLGARIATNEKKTLNGEIAELGKGYGSDTAKDVLFKFFENKEAPVMSFVMNWLDGKDAVGNEFNLPDAVKERMMPMIIPDVKEAFEEHGGLGLLYVIPAMFGASVSTYKPRKKKEKGEEDPFGDSDNPFEEKAEGTSVEDVKW